MKARTSSWKKRNPDKLCEYQNVRRARKVSATVDDSVDKYWPSILAAYGGLCAYCPAPATTRDHVRPLAMGGAHVASNIVPACLSCNCKKRDSLLWVPMAAMTLEAVA